MSRRNAVALAVRKRELVLRGGTLRAALTTDLAALGPLFGIADAALGAGRWLRAHPGVSLAALAVLVWKRPRAVWALARRAFSIWRACRQAGATVQSLLAVWKTARG